MAYREWDKRKWRRDGTFKSLADMGREIHMYNQIERKQGLPVMHVVSLLETVPGISGDEIHVRRVMMRAPKNVTVIGKRDEIVEYFKSAPYFWHLIHKHESQTRSWIRKFKWRTKVITENTLERVPGTIDPIFCIVKGTGTAQVLVLPDPRINRLLVDLGAMITDADRRGNYGTGRFLDDYGSVYNAASYSRFPRATRIRGHQQELKQKLHYDYVAEKLGQRHMRKERELNTASSDNPT